MAERSQREIVPAGSGSASSTYVPVPGSCPRNDEIERGRIQDCVPGNPTVLADIVAHPELYYVNVHNARFPGGAIRCQLEG